MHRLCSLICHSISAADLVLRRIVMASEDYRMAFHTYAALLVAFNLYVITYSLLQEASISQGINVYLGDASNRRSASESFT